MLMIQRIWPGENCLVLEKIEYTDQTFYPSLRTGIAKGSLYFLGAGAHGTAVAYSSILYDDALLTLSGTGEEVRSFEVIMAPGCEVAACEINAVCKVSGSL